MRILLCCGRDGCCVVLGDVARKPVVGRQVILRDARMVIEWDSECGGFFGLAARGPCGERTRITHPIPSTGETVWQEWL